MDGVIASLTNNIGYQFDNIKVSHLAFANSIILLASSRRGQSNLDKICNELGKCGLNISAGDNVTSAPLSNTIDEKNKKWLVNETSTHTIGGDRIHAI